MKTYETAREVKEALLSCETVKIKGWVARINENDDIEVSSPNGVKTANDICYLEMAIAEFMKEAGGMPDKTPTPVTFEAIPSGSGPLEDDTTSDSPWTDPKVNKQPVPQGATSEPGLGTDTTSDKPWVDPSVVKLPEDSAKMTLPDTNLGPDSGGNSTNWGEAKEAKTAAYIINFGGDKGTYDTWDHAYSAFKTNYMDQAVEKAKTADDSAYRVLNQLAEHSIEKVAQSSDSTIGVPSEDSEDDSPYAGVSGELPVVGEQVTPVADFHNAGIVDTYAEPKREATYREMVAASPSANLLRDIGDTERWTARQMLAQEDALLDEEDPYDENLESEEGHDMEARIKEAIHGFTAGITDTLENGINTFDKSLDFDPNIDPNDQLIMLNDNPEQGTDGFAPSNNLGPMEGLNTRPSNKLDPNKMAQDISLVEYIKEAVSTENMASVDDLLSRGVQLEVIEIGRAHV